MAIRRLRQPPHPVTLIERSAAPSRVWRASFLRPPARLKTTKFTPELGRLGLEGRTGPSQLHQWLRRIDRWIEYANSIVEE